MKELTLILGGARSGKSSHAQALGQASRGRVLFVATAQALDAEMAARIQAHRAARPAGWRTLEAPRQVGAAIEAALESEPAGVVLVDCLTLLVSNVVLALPEPVSSAQAEAAAVEEVEGLLAAWGKKGGRWIVVSNEVGLGLVPPYPVGRVYRDALGRANAYLAAQADQVLLMVAGIPMKVK